MDRIGSLLRRAMMSANVSLLSPYPLAECVARLQAAIDAERIFANPFAEPGTKLVIGRISSPFIYLHKRISYRNAFQTLLSAALSPQARGTTIVGKTHIDPIVRAWMIAINIAWVLIGGAMAINVFGSTLSGNGSQNQSVWIAMAAPIVMPALCYALFRFGQYLARDEARFLKDFLQRTLDAQEYGG